ncbi:MAG: acyltransferase, partial [Verrucomicrobia bacterium]|nr:acyltransferase [Verrucomicrobiota bacterium]
MRQIKSLTSLRFFAAASIVVLHSVEPFKFAKTDDLFPLQQGVSFFFVLSGFILASIYPKLTRSDLRAFYTARFARIWPAHVAVFLLMLAILPRSFWNFDGHPTISAAIANLCLVHGWIPARIYYFSYN